MGFNPFVDGSSGGGGTGRSILRIAFASSTKGNVPGIAGAQDTYVIYYSDSTTSSYIITNGKNGDGVLEASEGIEIVNDVIQHSNKIIAGSVGDDSSGVEELDYDSYFKIPYIQYDKNGHILMTKEKTLKLPKQISLEYTSKEDIDKLFI